MASPRQGWTAAQGKKSSRRDCLSASSPSPATNARISPRTLNAPHRAGCRRRTAAPRCLDLLPRCAPIPKRPPPGGARHSAQGLEPGKSKGAGPRDRAASASPGFREQKSERQSLETQGKPRSWARTGGRGVGAGAGGAGAEQWRDTEGALGARLRSG